MENMEADAQKALGVLLPQQQAKENSLRKSMDAVLGAKAASAAAISSDWRANDTIENDKELENE